MRTVTFLALALCSTLVGTPHTWAALDSDYEYYSDPAPSEIEEAVNDILQQSSLDLRFESARETPDGFLLLFHHNSCIDSTSLTSVVSQITSVLEGDDFDIDAINTYEEENLEGVDAIVVSVKGDDIPEFLVTGDENLYFASCFQFQVLPLRRTPTRDLFECCGYDWANCDGTAHKSTCEGVGANR